MTDTFEVVRTASVTSFTSREHGPQTAAARLRDLGFHCGAGRDVTRRLLDTFDGRLNAAGLRLELCELDGDARELILSGTGTATARFVVVGAPRFVRDLPHGPFSARLAALVDVRALLPVMSVEATATPFVLRDRTGKLVVTTTLYEDLCVVDHDDIDLAPWMIEVHALVGYAKRAKRVCEALEQLGLQGEATDVLTMAATSAAIDLSGFAGVPGVPLDPGMTAIDGFRAVLTNLADTISANWHGAADQIDPEFLHDLRVAVRRTRTVLRQGKWVLPESVVGPAVDRFGSLGTLTGPLRDLDVYLLEWDSYTAMFEPVVLAALEPVREVLERRHEIASATLTSALQSPEATTWFAEWQHWLTEPMPDANRGVHADRQLGHEVARHIQRAQHKLVTDGRLVEPDTPAEEVHNLRKDAKKLRYLFECFASLLPEPERKSFVQRLKALQDNLGEHQDAEVHVGELRAISHELHDDGASSATMRAIGQLTERLDERRVAARVAFAERFEAYDTPATRRALAAALEGIAR